MFNDSGIYLMHINYLFSRALKNFNFQWPTSSKLLGSYGTSYALQSREWWLLPYPSWKWIWTLIAHPSIRFIWCCLAFRMRWVPCVAQGERNSSWRVLRSSPSHSAHAEQPFFAVVPQKLLCLPGKVGGCGQCGVGKALVTDPVED